MKIKKMMALVLAGSMLAINLVGCGTKEQEPIQPQKDQETNQETGKIEGKITVLTNKTDIVDTVLVEYAKKFNEKYPDVKVEFEAMADYEGQVKIRMNTAEYGDVLLIPDGITIDKIPEFFEPLGKSEELDAKYYGVYEKAYDGYTYGIPVGVSVNSGFVYNKEVFEKAGIETLPTTEESFLDAMNKVKEVGSIPVYTNYAAAWPLNQWEGMTRGIDGNAEYLNELIKKDKLFTPGEPHYEVYKLMYDVVNQGLVEADPFTSDWEMSKQMCADGQVAVLPVGSWALGQVKALAENPDNIGYMPFPYEKDGKVYAQLGGDYKIGINVNSKNKEAARAWVDFFVEESGFALNEGMVSTLKSEQMPADYKAFEDLGVEFVVLSPTPEEYAGKIDAIDQEAEIGLWQEAFKQRIIEAALGNRQETYDDIINDLNQKWAEAQAQIMQ